MIDEEHRLWRDEIRFAGLLDRLSLPPPKAVPLPFEKGRLGGGGGFDFITVTVIASALFRTLLASPYLRGGGPRSGGRDN